MLLFMGRDEILHCLTVWRWLDKAPTGGQSFFLCFVNSSSQALMRVCVYEEPMWYTRELEPDRYLLHV